MPVDFPSWASWKSREVYLPANFHNASSFNKNLSMAKKSLGDASVFEGGRIDCQLLLLGLMYREVSRSVEIEPGAPTDAPDHLVRSTLGISHLNKIETAINQVVVPS